MTPRSRKAWGIFAACAALIVVALCWVTREMDDLSRREALAKAEARVQESMRLALWRMDSALAPIVAQEAARPPSEYPPATGGPPLPSAFAPFRLYFSIDESGRASSPEIGPFVEALRPKPNPQTRQVVLPDSQQEHLDCAPQDASAPHDAIAPQQEAARPEGELDLLAASRPVGGIAGAVITSLPPPPLPPQTDATEASPPAQVKKSKDEYQSRAKMAQQVTQTLTQNAWNNNLQFLQMGAVTQELESGPFEARWVTTRGSDLFFVRPLRDRSSGARSVQGIWCDWRRLEEWLLGSTRDLFPSGSIVPTPDPTAADQGTMLATIPARLAAGSVASPQDGRSPVTTASIVFAWAAGLGMIAAVGAILAAALSLGERRGRFVSAVTHELRTPLTTFRMYSQMLADGMVPPESRAEYLTTLKDESERLARVVESVLLYSRLEEGRGGAHRERMPCRALVDRILPAVTKRTADGGMALATLVEVTPDVAVEVDSQAVEQILLNLVDNACKYAAPADRRIEITWKIRGRMLEVACRDFGPGIPAGERDAIFLPFRRGTLHAAGTTPGVGLGLALARGLARALGGDLVLDLLPETGARFVLTIPLSPA